MRYLKLDVVNHTIIQVEGEGIEWMCQEIGCEMVEYRGALLAGKSASLWFDEEGLFNGAASRGGVTLKMDAGGHVHLLGNVLIAGPIDEDKGEERDVELQKEDLREKYQWLTSQIATAYAERLGYKQPTRLNDKS